jgi:hypothetical protein
MRINSRSTDDKRKTALHDWNCRGLATCLSAKSLPSSTARHCLSLAASQIMDLRFDFLAGCQLERPVDQLPGTLGRKRRFGPETTLMKLRGTGTKGGNVRLNGFG